MVVIKRFFAIIISILFYICTFEACWYVILKSHRNRYALFMYGFPLFIISYFILMGKMFNKRFKLSRWILWSSMNFVGFIISVIILAVQAPMLWFNAGMLLLLAPMVGVSIVLWFILGIITLIISWNKKIRGSPHTDLWKKL